VQQWDRQRVRDPVIFQRAAAPWRQCGVARAGPDALEEASQSADSHSSVTDKKPSTCAVVIDACLLAVLPRSINLFAGSVTLPMVLW
jgi:hypothetical protein